MSPFHTFITFMIYCQTFKYSRYSYQNFRFNIVFPQCLPLCLLIFNLIILQFNIFRSRFGEIVQNEPIHSSLHISLFYTFFIMLPLTHFPLPIHAFLPRKFTHLHISYLLTYCHPIFTFPPACNGPCQFDIIASIYTCFIPLNYLYNVQWIDYLMRQVFLFHPHPN